MNIEKLKWYTELEEENKMIHVRPEGHPIHTVATFWFDYHEGMKITIEQAQKAADFLVKCHNETIQ